MNWISNYVRPRINSIFSRREVPENLWTKCDECGTMLFHQRVISWMWWNKSVVDQNCSTAFIH